MEVPAKEHPIIPGYSMYSCKYSWWVRDEDGDTVFNFEDLKFAVVNGHAWPAIGHSLYIDDGLITSFVEEFTYDVQKVPVDMNNHTVIHVSGEPFVGKVEVCPLVTQDGRHLALVFEPLEHNGD